MTPERWARIKRLFSELVSIAEPEQDRYLDALPDEALRGELRRLLVHARHSTGIVDRRAIDLISVEDAADTLPVGDRFALGRKLGAGGMGVVYEAFDELLQARVALKALRRITPSSIALFKREFRALVDLRHPNLVSLYDLFSSGNQWFFTMEFIDGLTLLEHLGAQGDARARMSSLRPILLSLADGLRALHDVGKLHRDLKPGNVMVTATGRVVLLDFGLVHDIEEAPHAGTALAGTARYMSPEQVLGHSLAPASDWYALGVLMYQALTAELPRSAAERLRGGHTDVDDLTLPLMQPELPADLAELCVNLLSLAPEQRFDGAEVLRRLGAGGSAPARARAASVQAPFFGRHEELAVLEEMFVSAADERPAIVCIEGQSGTGKTALVQHFLTRPAMGQTFLRCRCHERESVAFNVFDSLTDDLSARLRQLEPEMLRAVVPQEIAILAQMFPVLRWLALQLPRTAPPVDQRQQRRIASRVLRDLLSRLARVAPLAIWVDDLQWGDADSATMLGELLRGPDAPPVLYILTFRAEDRARSVCVEAALEECHRMMAGRCRQIHLGALDVASSVSLGASLVAGGAVANEVALARAHAIARESGGNPYFIRELAAYVLRLEPSHSTRASAEGLSLTAVIEARANQLPEPARRLLEVVAVAGRPLRSADAIDAAAGEDRSPTWLALLRSDQFVRTIVGSEQELVEPYHDRMRETILATLTGDRKQRRHQQLAETLERSGAAEPELLATHYESAGNGARAGRYYAAAAQQADAALAFNSAADRYGRALALSEYTEAERVSVTRSWAQALANAGRGFEAAEAFRTAADKSTPEGLASFSRAGYHYAASGRVDEATNAFAVVLARLRIRLPLRAALAMPALIAMRVVLQLRGLRFRERSENVISQVERARIDLCWFVGAGLGLVQLMTGALFTTYALLLALRSGDAFRIARALTWEAAICASQSRRGKRQAEHLFAVCRPIVARLDHPYTSGMLALTEGQAEFSHGRWTSALEKFDDARQLFERRCTGVGFELATLQGFRLQTLAYMGEYGQLKSAAAEQLDMSRAAGDLYLETFVRGAIQPLLCLAEDRPDLARASIDAALSGWPSRGYHLQHALIDQVRLWVELYSGNASGAQTIVDRQWPLLRRSHLLFNQNLRAKMFDLQARCAVGTVVAGATGDRTAASRLVARVQREREPYMSGSILSLRAALARADGDTTRAEEDLRSASDAFDQWQMRDFSAAARIMLSEWSPGAADAGAGGEAAAWMNAHGIQNPRRWARMRIPSAS